MKRVHEYLVILHKPTNRLRISRVAVGYRPSGIEADYTWGGPYKSLLSARQAISFKDEDLHKQLYGGAA